MTNQSGLKFGKIPATAKHICVDMQRLFADDTPWKVKWLDKIAPNVEKLVAFKPSATIFTRFIPVNSPADARGSWRRFYEHWNNITLDVMDPSLIEVIPSLQKFSPPALFEDKYVYSPWASGRLHTRLHQSNTSTLIISGGETDMCVLSTVLGAIDYGYRVILASDALCCSSDQTHDQVVELWSSRYTHQIEMATTDDIISSWGP